MPSNWLLFDRIRALAKSNRIYQSERIFQDQSQLDRLIAGSEFLDFNQQAHLLDQTNLQINRLERYRDYEQMDQMGEISLALDLYSDEGALVDPERKHTLVIRARNKRLKRELEDLYYNILQWDTYCRPSIRYLCKYGDFPAEVITDVNRGGVASLRFMNVYNFTRIETRYGDLVGFFYQDPIYPQPLFLHPWQVMHLRLTSFENSYHPYGKCCHLDSKVLTPNGYRELGNIKLGDTVFSFNGLRPIATTVRGITTNTIKSSLKLSTKYRSLTVSEDHPILAILTGANGRLFRRYVPAKHVVPGSKIVTHDPEHDESNSYMVEEIVGRKEIGLRQLGDIQVDSGYSNFVSDGVVVHNSVIDGGRRAHRQLRLMEDAALIYRICLRGDQLIWTPTGHTSIKDLKIGDMVYCFKNGKPKLTKVVDWQCNGKDVIYRVFSQHREIFANATHPILVETSYSNKRKKDRPARLEYVDIKDIIAKRNGIASHHRFLLPQIEHEGYVQLKFPKIRTYAKLLNVQSEHSSLQTITKREKLNKFLDGEAWFPSSIAEAVCAVIGEGQLEYRQGWCVDHGKNICREYNLPDYADEDFARWFGFMIGDGYVSERIGYADKRTIKISEVGMALGDDFVMNQEYIQRFNKYVGVSHHTAEHRSNGDGKQYVYSKPFVEFMLLNGFIPGAENKRIPNWVYRSPRNVQEAFIDGYIDADHNSRMFKGGVTEAHELECCNEMLCRDLKELCHRLGWDVGLVRKRERKNGHEIEPGRIMPPTTSWCLYFTKNQKHSMEYVVPIGERHTNASESILGVEEISEDLVYDITVDDDVHNIIVNGIPTSQTRAPEKRKFTIPVGNIPAKEVPEYMQMIARGFKRQRFYNPTTGMFDERYSPLIQDDDFFLPRRSDGTGPEIDTLPGAENLDQIADIEYFKKKMIAPTKIPFARVGIGEGAGESSEKSLSQSHSEFSKAVQWVQREVATGLTKVGIIHLALRGFSVEDLKGFEIALTATSAMEELYRIETWQTRVSVMTDLKDLGWFPKEWIVTHFTDLSPDEIEELKDMEDAASGGGGGGGGAPGGLDIGDNGEGGGDLGGVGAPPGEAGGPPGAPGGAVPGEEDEETPPIAPALEGFDYGAQRRLIRGLIKEGKRREVKELLVEWAKRLGRVGDSDRELMSGYSHLLSLRELDGLSVGTIPEKVESCVDGVPGVFNPNMDTDNLLVEWGLDDDGRAAIKENYDIVCESEDLGDEEDDGEVSSSDLPK